MRSIQAEEMSNERSKGPAAGPLLENDRVRVLSSVIGPGERKAMHSHPDHVIYVVKGGKVRSTSSEGSQDLDLVRGEALFMGPMSHEVTNIGDTEVDLVVFEIK